jgi:hypothetical protein
MPEKIVVFDARVTDGEGYYKKMALKYREKFHETQSELFAITEKLETEKNILEKIFQQSIIDLETAKNQEIIALKLNLNTKVAEILEIEQIKKAQ